MRSRRIQPSICARASDLVTDCVTDRDDTESDFPAVEEEDGSSALESPVAPIASRACTAAALLLPQATAVIVPLPLKLEEEEEAAEPNTEVEWEDMGDLLRGVACVFELKDDDKEED